MRNPKERYRLMAHLQDHADATRAVHEQRLEEQGRECPSCGIRKLPEAFGTKRNGKPQDSCKLCLQDRRDATRASREGFESVEAMRDHYAAKKLARRRAKAAKRFNYKPTKDYKPKHSAEPRALCPPVDLTQWETWLQPYLAMADVVNFCANNPKESVLFRHHWATPEKLRRRGIHLSTKKKHAGGWPWQFWTGMLYLPPESE